MTRPHLYRGRENPASPLTSLSWFSAVLTGTLAGGWVAALICFFDRKNDLALGLFLGSFFSVLNFLGLRVLSAKILESGDLGRKSFWLWNVVRWFLSALVCWLLLRKSPACLLGALGSYLWFLLVLAWVGWRSTSLSSTSAKRP